MNKALRHKKFFIYLICFILSSIAAPLFSAEDKDSEAGQPGLDYEAAVVEVIVPPDIEKDEDIKKNSKQDAVKNISGSLPAEEKDNASKDTKSGEQQINSNVPERNIPPLLAAPQKNKKKNKDKVSKERKQKKTRKKTEQGDYDTSESEKYIFVSKPDKYNNPDIDFSEDEEEPMQKTKIPRARDFKWIHKDFMNVPKFKQKTDPDNDTSTKKTNYIRCRKGCSPHPSARTVKEKSVPAGITISDDYKCWKNSFSCIPGSVLYIFNLEDI